MSFEQPAVPPSHQQTHRFIQALCAMTALPRVARVEVRVFDDDADATFAIGEVLASLWPDQEARPRHEVVWAKRPGSSGGVALTAFDIDGRVLHRQA